jgi:hypothetical protein
VTALEALVMTGERNEIAAEVSARATALCFDPERDDSFEEVLGEISMRTTCAPGSRPAAPSTLSHANRRLALNNGMLAAAHSSEWSSTGRTPPEPRA